MPQQVPGAATPHARPAAAPGASGDAQRARSRRRGLVWAGVALALAAVFAAYLNPHTVVDLATRVWSCF